MANVIPFYKYSYEFWNSCYDLLEPETQCYANEGDFVFLCDGVLFLISDPYGVANLVVQRIAPSIHPVPPTKHIYELVLWLSDLSVKYLQFHGRPTRYSSLFSRLFRSSLSAGDPWILQTQPVDDQDNFVVSLCPSCVDYCCSQLKDISFSRIIQS